MARALSAMAVALPLEVTTPVRLALFVTDPAVKLDAVPDALVATRADGVPRAGVTRVGLVPNTASPEPVSLVKAVASCAEVKLPSTAAFPELVTWPVRLAFVVTVAAFPVVLPDVPDAFPVTLPVTFPVN
jgi:hypothetical protein